VDLDPRSFRDLGLSAYKGKNVETGQLGLFLTAVERGDIPPGSVLIVEALDRLTRQEILKALELFTRILNADISIVTLDPEREYTREVVSENAIVLMEVVLMFFLAAEQSRRKSTLNSAAWAAKRLHALEDILTARVPCWLRVVGRTREGKRMVGGRFVEIAEKVELVRTVFRLAIEGEGLTAICKGFNDRRIPSIGKGGLWNTDFIGSLLRNPAVVGVYQPHTGHGGRKGSSRRQPVGDPVEGYFPAVVSELDFLRVSVELTRRKTVRGPSGKNGEVANLFTSLLRDARDGSFMHIQHKDAEPVLASSAAIRGKPGASYVSFPLWCLELALFAGLDEIKASELQGADRAASTRVDDLRTRLADLQQRLDAAKAKADSHPDVDDLLDIVVSLAEQKQQVADDLKRAEQAAQVASPDALADCQDLAALMLDARGEERNRLRVRFKARLRELVTSMWLLPVALGATSKHPKVAALQVYFRDGSCRTWYVLYQPAITTPTTRQPAGWQVLTQKDAGMPKRDLRDAAAATETEDDLRHGFWPVWGEFRLSRRLPVSEPERMRT
jgi:DNA invertase Pin-like site-specific DNA recombinase